jgi:hypothetical protein
LREDKKVIATTVRAVYFLGTKFNGCSATFATGEELPQLSQLLQPEPQPLALSGGGLSREARSRDHCDRDGSSN